MCLTVGSLFSGIGGIELGLERCGMKTLWQVENAPYPRAVLKKLYPHVEQFEDIRSVGSHNLKPVDVICGGFPCQGISVIGRGEGLEDERSGLWFEYLRVVRELRPRFVLVENSPRLVALGLDRVLGSLAEIGYDAEWDCLRASDIGAPHRRERIWIVAYPNGAGLEGYAGHGDTAKGWPFAPRSAREGGVSPGEHAAGWWDAEPGVGRVANGVPSRVDRIEALGNAVVPQVAEERGRYILSLAAAS